MTHSSRKSYKEKYLALKNESSDIRREEEILAGVAEFHASADAERKRYHAQLVEVAEVTTELVELLDCRNGQFGLNIKDIRKPIDATLSAYDSGLILRRTRDVLKHACARLAIAGLKSTEDSASLQSLKVGAQLLKSPLHRSFKGLYETHEIGKDPTDAELLELEEHPGRNPREKTYIYHTDNDDSESESEDEADLSDEERNEDSRGMVVATQAAGNTRAQEPTARNDIFVT
jgi:hypothetical protein